jgi:hypothetical protein
MPLPRKMITNANVREKVTASTTLERSHNIFHFRLLTWATAGLAWAMGEHSWAQPEYALIGYFGIYRSSF